MAGAIPRFFRMVPVYDAAQMRADGGTLVKLAGVIAVHGNFLQTAANDSARARGDQDVSVNVAAGGPIAILRGDIEVLFREIFGGAEGLARRLVKACPGVFAPLNQVGEVHARNRAVRDPDAWVSAVLTVEA